MLIVIFVSMQTRKPRNEEEKKGKDYFGEGRNDRALFSPPAMEEREEGGREEEGVVETEERILELTISVLSFLDPLADPLAVVVVPECVERYEPSR